MLDVRSLSISYGQHKALENADVHVGRGEIVVILGANGAGKSSLLKAISGISEGQVSGSITMQGHELVGIPANKIVENGIALVPEGRGVFPDLSVRENLRLGAYGNRARDDEDGNFRNVLELFPKLGERSRQIVRTMSGGEQQMVAIGRAMMSNPAILTLDEPSLGLSPLLCKELFQSLKVVKSAGIGILLVEQNAKQSLAIADRGYLIENGHIVHEAPADKLMNDPAVQKAYLGGASSGQAAPVTPSAERPARPLTPPRPKGQTPADIAAAALQNFKRPPAPMPAPAPVPSAPSMTPKPPAPKLPMPTPPATSSTPRALPANGTRAASDVLGVGIDDLVARAAAASAKNVSRRPNGSQSNNAMPSATPYRSTLTNTHLNMPSLADSQDRLQAALLEIEQAAARARAYRPRGDK